MCVAALAEDLEARAMKSSAQTKAPGNTPRANARPTQDGRRGLQRQREPDGEFRANWFYVKPGAFSLLEQGDLQEKFLRFNMCITTVLLYQYRHYCRRPPWEKWKIRDHDHTRPEPYPNPNWNAMG